jgi:hypothetical protein
MLADDFAALELSRYELKLRAREAASLPTFLGSTLRGAFGHALKEAVCVMSHRQCDRCLVASRCIYPYVFETPVPPGVPQLKGQQQAPHPFILTSPVLRMPERSTQALSAAARAGVQQLPDGRAVRLVRAPVAGGNERRRVVVSQELRFGLLLMGRAVEYLPYVVYAVSEMAQRGLGVNRARFELSTVAVVEDSGASRTIYTGESQRISIHSSTTRRLDYLIEVRLSELVSALSFKPDRIKLRFQTPTRIRVEGDLQVGMSFDLLVRNLLRRVSMLAAVHGAAPLDLDYRGLIAKSTEVATHRSALRWVDWERYSSRQQTKMSMGGFIGEVEYRGDQVEEFLPLLVAGEILHVGTGTGFGLGKYEIVE